jgi:hypothetical protein
MAGKFFTLGKDLGSLAVKISAASSLRARLPMQRCFALTLK